MCCLCICQDLSVCEIPFILYYVEEAHVWCTLNLSIRIQLQFVYIVVIIIIIYQFLFDLFSLISVFLSKSIRMCKCGGELSVNVQNTELHLRTILHLLVDISMRIYRLFVNYAIRAKNLSHSNFRQT